MKWEIEYTDEFGEWWDSLTETQRETVAYTVNLLEQDGPALKFPHSSKIQGSKYGNMRELRSQCNGRPLRTFYAFDPGRNAILLIGGDKTGDDRFYEVYIPKADKIYGDYLKEIAEEGK
jgi:hypothetical protein